MISTLSRTVPLSQFDKCFETKPVVMYNFITNEPIQEYESIAKANRLTRVSSSTISKHCNNKSIKFSLAKIKDTYIQVYFKFKNNV